MLLSPHHRATVRAQSTTGTRRIGSATARIVHACGSVRCVVICEGLIVGPPSYIKRREQFSRPSLRAKFGTSPTSDLTALKCTLKTPQNSLGPPLHPTSLPTYEPPKIGIFVGATGPSRWSKFRPGQDRPFGHRRHLDIGRGGRIGLFSALRPHFHFSNLPSTGYASATGC